MSSPRWRATNFTYRLALAYRACSALKHSNTFWLLFAQPQLTPNCLVSEDLNEVPGQHSSLVCHLAGVLSDHWRNDIECSDFSGWQHLFRTAVRLNGFRAAFESGHSSPMLVYLGFFHLDHDPYYGTYWCSWSDFSSERLTHRLRAWIRELIDAGQDLQEYGRWEREWLSVQGQQFPPTGARHRVGYACHVANFTYGPKLEDWEIWAVLSSEECVGEFWESLSDPGLSVPGSWPTPWMTSASDHDTQDFEKHEIDFRMSKRRRRRLVGYWGLTREQFEQYYDLDMRTYVAKKMEEGKQRKARQKQFFKEAGITPLPNR